MSIGGDGYGERDRTGQGGPEYGHDSGRLTTRTHLPEGESGTRPTPRPGKSLLTVVGVVVLLIAAIAFANQGGGESEEPTGADGNGGGAAEAQPTQPSGEKPVANVSGTIASDFPKTKQGAESAAANYAVALVSADIIKPSSRDGIVKQVFAPGKTDEMLAKMDKAYSPTFLKKMNLDANGNAKKGTYVSRTAPVGTKVRGINGTSAKVDVWCTGVFGTAGEGSTNPVTSDWFTMRMDLRWSGESWKVDGFSQKDGPAPVDGDNTASSADEISAAVEKFGGFTYAR